jgi:hypothetical protein
MCAGAFRPEAVRIPLGIGATPLVRGGLSGKKRPAQADGPESWEDVRVSR